MHKSWNRTCWTFARFSTSRKPSRVRSWTWSGFPFGWQNQPVVVVAVAHLSPPRLLLAAEGEECCDEVQRKGD